MDRGDHIKIVSISICPVVGDFNRVQSESESADQYSASSARAARASNRTSSRDRKSCAGLNEAYGQARQRGAIDLNRLAVRYVIEEGTPFNAGAEERI